MSYSQQHKLARAQLLQHQHRHKDAADELRQALTSDPHDAMAHAMLAVSLMELNQPKDATAEAQQAVGLAPDLAYAHYTLAFILFKRNWLDEAKESAEEALRLESFNPNHFSLLAAIELERRNWPSALEHADDALKIDPENAWATNLRAMALVKLGRRDEAASTIGDSLARDPENAHSHANQGWTLLHRGDHKQARVHFREALRIDPTLDWARAGMVEALKSGFWPYRMLLLFWLWMARLSAKAQWAVILGAWVGYQVIRNVTRNNPALFGLLWPLMLAYLLFVVLTWLAYPLLNLMLRLHRDGKYALSREQIISSNIIGLLLAICATSICLRVATGYYPWTELAIVSGFLVMPVAGAFMCPRGWPRYVMFAVAAGLAGLGLFNVAMFMTAQEFTRADPRAARADDLGWIFVYGIVASSFLSNFLRAARPRS